MGVLFWRGEGSHVTVSVSVGVWKIRYGVRQEMDAGYRTEIACCDQVVLGAIGGDGTVGGEAVREIHGGCRVGSTVGRGSCGNTGTYPVGVTACGAQDSVASGRWGDGAKLVYCGGK